MGVCRWCLVVLSVNRRLIHSVFGFGQEASNILSKTYSDGTVIPYPYRTSGWTDQLISYNGQSITYDSNDILSYYIYNLQGDVIGLYNRKVLYLADILSEFENSRSMFRGDSVPGIPGLLIVLFSKTIRLPLLEM